MNGTVRGTRVLFGEDARKLDSMCEWLGCNAGHHRYQRVILPSMWTPDVFVERGGPEIQEQMYTFKDKGNRDICLIPEATAIIADLYRNSWSKTEKKPLRLFYAQRFYRYERPQEGRYREFWQFGMELLGGTSPSDSDEIKNIMENMIRNNLPEGAPYTFLPSVKRGLGYYIEDGFEITMDILGAQKQIAGGGRYPEGVGFAIGVDRLLLARERLNNG